MVFRRSLAAIVILAFAACGAPQAEPQIVSAPPPPASPMPVAPVIPQPSAEQPMPNASDLVVASDVSARLAKFAPFVADFDDKSLTAEEKLVLRKLVESSQIIHELFLRQVDPTVPELRARIASDPSKTDALKYFDIMAGPWDILAHDEPFIGSRKRPAGGAFYPVNMAKTELEDFVNGHPEQRESFQSYFTVVVRRDGRLTPVPYAEAYKAWLEPAAAKLREAAAATKEPTLRKFLELRAAAFSSNDYVESDKAWMDVNGSIELTMGPYETYADQLFQYKATFESFLSLRDTQESKKLEVIGKQMGALQKNLPMSDKHKKQAEGRGMGSPMDVVHLVCTAGHAGVQTVAYNLPNDERVRKEKGSKKVMLKNVLQGKFENIVAPIAAKVIAEDQLPLLNAEAVFTYILMHEVAHGLGPGFITLKDGTKGEVHKALRDLYGGIEEAKADITGLVDVQYLIDQKIYPKELEKQIYVGFLATAFRQMRFGLSEAHGRGVVSSFNYITEKGGIVYDSKSGRFRIDFGKIKKAVRDLAHEYLTIEAEGNYDGAKAFLEKYAKATPEIQRAVDRIGSGIPVDIALQFTIYDKMKNW